MYSYEMVILVFRYWRNVSVADSLLGFQWKISAIQVVFPFLGRTDVLTVFKVFGILFYFYFLCFLKVKREKVALLVLMWQEVQDAHVVIFPTT